MYKSVFNKDWMQWEHLKANKMTIDEMKEQWDHLDKNNGLLELKQKFPGWFRQLYYVKFGVQYHEI